MLIPGSQKASSPLNSCTVGQGCAPTSSPISTPVFRASRPVRLWLDRNSFHRYRHPSFSSLFTESAWTYSLQLGRIDLPWSTASVDTLGRLDSPTQQPATCFRTWILGLRTSAGRSSFVLTTARNFAPSLLSSVRLRSLTSYPPPTIQKATVWLRRLSKT